MKQLLKQIYNERRSNAFLWIELLLVFVVLWYIVDLVYVTLHIYYQPMGFNIENTYVLRMNLSLIHISEPTRLGMISYAVFCLKKKK